jgi:hypothetical protein
VITSIRLTNVRTFAGKPWTFNLGSLTALCGGNSAGKSTIIKALLFVKSNARAGDVDIEGMGRVQFSGDNFDLGDFRSFVTNNDVRKKISIGLTFASEAKLHMPHLKRLLPRQFEDFDESSDQTPNTPYVLETLFTFRYVAATERKRKKRIKVLQDDPGFGVLETTSFSLFVKGKFVGLACTRFRRHRVRCFDGTGGASWRGGSLRESSSLRLCG